MFYVLLGSDRPKVYVKKCSNNKYEIHRETETDFVVVISDTCGLCLYNDICNIKQNDNEGD